MANKKMLPIKHVRFTVRYPNTTGTLDLNLERFEGQYDKAQYWLDSRVMTDMVPFMPMRTGTFIQITRAMSQSIAGSGKVVAAAPPYGRFLYMGKVMVDEKTGSTYARKGAKKVLVSKFAGMTNAKEDIEYSKNANPKATSKWYEAAENLYRDSWIEGVKKRAGGGNGK